MNNLTEAEKAQVAAFCANPAMLAAVRKALTFNITEVSNWVYGLDLNMKDEDYARKVKTMVIASSVVTESFDQMVIFSTPAPVANTEEGAAL